MDNIKEKVDAAEKAVSFTAQYPLAVALLVVALFSGFVIWLLFKYVLKGQNERLQKSVENDVKIASLLNTQAKTIAAQNVELNALRESYVQVAVALAKLAGKAGVEVNIPTSVRTPPPADGG